MRFLSFFTQHILLKKKNISYAISIEDKLTSTIIPTYKCYSKKHHCMINRGNSIVNVFLTSILSAYATLALEKILYFFVNNLIPAYCIEFSQHDFYTG